MQRLEWTNDIICDIILLRVFCSTHEYPNFDKSEMEWILLYINVIGKIIALECAKKKKNSNNKIKIGCIYCKIMCALLNNSCFLALMSFQEKIKNAVRKLVTSVRSVCGRYVVRFPVKD